MIVKYIAQITLVEHNLIATHMCTHQFWFKDLHIQFNDIQSIPESVRKLSKQSPDDILILKGLLKKYEEFTLKSVYYFFAAHYGFAIVQVHVTEDTRTMKPSIATQWPHV